MSEPSSKRRRVSERAQIEQPWAQLVARLEAAPEEWNDYDMELVRNALLCWENAGFHEAQDWNDDKRQQFKGEWEAWRAEAQKKMADGGKLTLEEERYRAYGKGVWWAIGYSEGQRMDALAVEKFKSDRAEYASADARRVSEGRERTLRDEAREDWAQGAWRAEGERHSARLTQAAARTLEAARQRLKPWPDELAREDYDFSAWVDRIQKLPEDEQRAWLLAGVFYEYARESYKLRGLLTLLEPPSDEDKDDIARPDSFDGLDESTAEKALGKSFTVLLALADELAGNLPFGKVDPKRVDAALFLRGTDKEGNPVRLSCLELEFGRTVWHVPPVAPAFVRDRDIAAGLDTMWVWRDPRHGEEWPEEMKPPKRTFLPDHDGENCEEVLLVRVNWRDFTDEELGEAFQEFARRYRPSGQFPQPKPKSGPGQRWRVNLKAKLDDLIAMRLVRRMPSAQAMTTFEETALNRKDHHSWANENNARTKGRNAVSHFADLFPFNEEPANAGTWKQRVLG